MPFPGAITASASKSMSGFLNNALSYELSADKIDCLNWMPWEVKTKLLDANTAEPKQIGGLTIGCQTAVKDMLSKVGREQSTHGNLRHGMIANFLTLIPESILLRKFYRDFC